MSQERKTELLKLCINTFCNHGLEGTTTKKLAKEAGLSEAGLYVYFKSKEEIILQCYEYIIQNNMQEISYLIKKHRDHPEAFVHEMFTYFKNVLKESRFVIQVFMHPYYSTLIRDIRNIVLNNIYLQSKIMLDFLKSEEKAYAVAQLFNSALNNYIMTQNEKSFQLQMKFLLGLLHDSQSMYQE